MFDERGGYRHMILTNRRGNEEIYTYDERAEHSDSHWPASEVRSYYREQLCQRCVAG